MYGLRRALFGTPGRRWLSLLVSVGFFFGAGWLIHGAVVHDVSSPGLSFVLVACWMLLGCCAALVTTAALGDRLFHKHWSEQFLRDEMAELDARIDGRLEIGVIEEDDEVLALSARDGTFRFGLYFLAIAFAFLMLSNASAGGFLQYYSRHGVAVVHMRSDDTAQRRRGLSMLASRLDVDGAHREVSDVVVRALSDPDEGVAARAAFVAGTLQIEAAAAPLAAMVRQQPALAFTALIALGQIEGEVAQAAARDLIDAPNALAEPRALALMIGLLELPAPDVLKRIYAEATDEKVRVAAIWSLGRVRDTRQLDFFAKALLDEALVVRCVAAEGLQRMVELAAYEPLRDAFERSTDPLEMCPAAVVPVQEGGRQPVLVQHRNYQLVLVRALSTTDHPDLLKWLVDHQEGREWVTYKFMEKKWKALSAKDKRGELNMLKRRVRARRLKEQAARGRPDAEVRPQPDP